MTLDGTTDHRIAKPAANNTLPMISGIGILGMPKGTTCAKPKTMDVTATAGKRPSDAVNEERNSDQQVCH